MILEFGISRELLSKNFRLVLVLFCKLAFESFNFNYLILKSALCAILWKLNIMDINTIYTTTNKRRKTQRDSEIKIILKFKLKKIFEFSS